MLGPARPLNDQRMPPPGLANDAAILADEDALRLEAADVNAAEMARGRRRTRNRTWRAAAKPLP
jgi:hypothetical protein